MDFQQMLYYCNPVEVLDLRQVVVLQVEQHHDFPEEEEHPPSQEVALII